ncbi:Two-component response regulator ARR2-like protein [Drosera capensis]
MEAIVGARVLVVDDDSTCLTIISAMLRSLGHEVVTAKNPLDALCTLRSKHDLFGLVLSDVHMPEMSGLELQKQVIEEFAMPVVLMSSDDRRDLMLKALENGAIFFILKPIQVDDLKNLWQLAITGRKKGKSTIVSVEAGDAFKGLQGEHFSPDDSNFSVPSNDLHKYERRYLKRKASDEVGDDANGNKVLCLNPKKQKVVWTISLHNRFLEAIEKIGFNQAVPKKILQHMKVRGLTRDHKYRMFLKRASAGTSSSDHERSWKEKPLGSKHVVSRRQFLGPNFQDKGLKTFAHLNLDPRSPLRVVSNFLPQVGYGQLQQWSSHCDIQPQLFGGPGDAIIPTNSNFEMMGMEGSSGVQLYGGHFANETTFGMQLPQQNWNLLNQCSDIHIASSNQDINGMPLGFARASSNAYLGTCAMENNLDNTNLQNFQQNLETKVQAENVSNLACLSKLQSELEKHVRSSTVDLSEFDGLSFMELLDDGNGGVAHNNLFGLPDQEIPQCGFLAESSLLKESQELQGLDKGPSDDQILPLYGHGQGPENTNSPIVPEPIEASPFLCKLRLLCSVRTFKISKIFCQPLMTSEKLQLFPAKNGHTFFCFALQ